MSNIFYTLVANSVFLKHKKFKSHKECITLRDTLHDTIQELLMLIDLEDEENITDNEGKPIGKQRIVISALYLYIKEVGDDTGHKRIITFAYEIGTSLDNATMLKQILCKTSSESSSDIKFILYGLNTLTKKEAMREIVNQQNVFLSEAKIVPIFGIMSHDKQQVADILGK